MSGLKLLFATTAIALVASLPPGSGIPSFVNSAHAGPGGGQGGGAGGAGGPGNSGGAGAAGAENGAGNGVGRGGPDAASHGRGNATAAAAVDPNTTGLDKAAAVVGTTPANQQALDSIAANQERQAAEDGTTDGTNAEDSDMSLSEAVSNMSNDVRGALSDLFGGSSE